MSSDAPVIALRRAILALAACFTTVAAFAQQGALTVPRNLQELVAGSADIVRGTVLSAHVEKHPELQNLDTLVVTLKVRETIKGGARDTYTFRQYLWDRRDVREAADYYKGQDYVLLMNAPSRYGLTSPTGMEQGRFRILHDETGREVAVNGRGNAFLMRGVSATLEKSGAQLSPDASRLATTHQKGPIAVSELLRLVRELAQGST